jgi:hypothetical protein
MMHRLAILRYCRDVLAERQHSDRWQGWFWAIRCKVVEYWIAVLEREPGDPVPELSPDEKLAVRRSHPLLASRPVTSAAALELDRDWQIELHRRVERYVEGLKAHR